MNILKNIQLSRLLEEFGKLRHNISEWVIALDTKQYNLQERVKELEGRIKELENTHGKVIR